MLAKTCFVSALPLSAVGCQRPRSLCSRPPPRAMSSDGVGAMDVLQQRLGVIEALQGDLRMQYDTPRQMDWDLYDDAIDFDDPLTTLSGKLAYKVRFHDVESYMRKRYRVNKPVNKPVL